ncbi:MAG: DUF4390 domain-containing protein [Gammaproteobacteria bacterium]|nr:DUF4390 domain-containing protein [Gammaproteobacteria bacterium]
MRSYASLLSIFLFVLVGCGQPGAVDYGFTIKNVTISQTYQSLNVHLRQDLQLSQQAREALEHGVILIIMLTLELNNDDNMMVVRKEDRSFQLRYLPLSERYQLSEEGTGELRAFSRLRHLLASINDLNIQMTTGPLLPGSYELRTRIRLDESQLPTPMQIPAWFSPQWQHDSEWSVWPFEINV